MSSEASLTGALLQRVRHDSIEAHQRVLSIANELTEDELKWRAGPFAPSIAFHVWHLARWAEHDIEGIEGTPQRWRTESMAKSWGFPEGAGEDDTGTELSDEAAAQLVFPEKRLLLDYAVFALGSIDALVARLTNEAEYGATNPEVVANLFVFLTHDNRHLGMIEALKGVMGTRGTATR